MLVVPCYKITVGNWRLTRLASLELTETLGAASAPRLRIELDASRLPVEPIMQTGDPIRVWEGYKGIGLWNVFNGEIADIKPGPNFEVIAVDDMEKLRRTKLVQTFVDVEPADIVEALVREAGVKLHGLSTRQLPRRHQYVLAGEDGLTALKKVNRAWDLNWIAYCDPQLGFYWGPWEDSPRYQEGELLTLAVGKNLEELTPSDQETGYASTLSLPYVRPGHRVRLEDERYWRRSVIARIDRVQHTRTDTEVRTWMEWRIVQR